MIFLINRPAIGSLVMIILDAKGLETAQGADMMTGPVSAKKGRRPDLKMRGSHVFQFMISSSQPCFKHLFH